MIFSHENKSFQVAYKLGGEEIKETYEKSKKLIEEVIPQIKTHRSWATVNMPTLCEDNSIIVVSRKNLDYLKKYKNLILICEDESRKEELSEYGIVLILDVFSKEGIEELQTKLDEIDQEVKEKIEKETKEVNEFLEKFDEENDVV